MTARCPHCGGTLECGHPCPKRDAAKTENWERSQHRCWLPALHDGDHECVCGRRMAAHQDPTLFEATS